MGSCTSINTGDYQGEYPNFSLNVISKISGDPEKCLFDYQYNNSSEHKEKISACDAQVKTNCFLHAMQSELPVDETQPKKTAAVHDRMLAFTFTQGKYWVFNGKESETELKWDYLKDKAWMVLNKVNKNKQSQIVKNGQYKLHDGDIVRFGRVVFKVSIVTSNKSKNKPDWEDHFDLLDKQPLQTNDRQMWSSTKTIMPEYNAVVGIKEKSKFTSKHQELARGADSISENSLASENSDGKPETVKEEQEKVWRICYGEEEDEIEDPLIEPWNCTGSVSFIHLSCAKAWINEELTQDITDDVKSYCWERISCEMCHSNFKEVIYQNGRVIKLFEKEKIKADTYIVLESIYPEYIKIYFGLIVEKGKTEKNFLLGRSRNWSIKLNLDSISRSHSEISYEKGEFYIKDCGSTFGTLVLLRHPLVFSKKKKDEIAIQSGPTLIEIKHGGSKKIEHTYISKDGTQKKCAVYSEFKHKIPSHMRDFIDKHTGSLEVIRADQYRKVLSTKNINGQGLDYEKTQEKYLSNKNMIGKYESEVTKQTSVNSSNRRIVDNLAGRNNDPNHLAVPTDMRLNNLPSVSEASKNSRVDSLDSSSESPEISPNLDPELSHSKQNVISEDHASAVLRDINSSSEEEKEHVSTKIEKREASNKNLRFSQKGIKEDNEYWEEEYLPENGERVTLPAENSNRQMVK